MHEKYRVYHKSMEIEEKGSLTIKDYCCHLLLCVSLIPLAYNFFTINIIVEIGIYPQK